MKSLVCEMCNSSDLIKQDGCFICQCCGTKYSVEEAKKMMIEGTVNVRGIVQVDNSSFVEKYLQNARRAMQKEDWEEVEKYYNMVEQDDPSNIEAIFYSAYGRAKASLTINDIYKREAIFKALRNSISLLDDHYDVNNAAACNQIMEKIVNDVIRMFGSEFVYTVTTDGYGNKSDDANQTRKLFISLADELRDALRNITSKIPPAQKDDLIFALKLRLKVIDFLTTEQGSIGLASRITNAGLGQSVVDAIKQVDPSYVGRDYNALVEELNAISKASFFRFMFTAGLIIFACVALIIAIVNQ